MLDPRSVFPRKHSLHMVCVRVALHNVLGSMNAGPHVSRPDLAFLLLSVNENIVLRC